jgi:predicted nucleotidyltransferase
MSGSAAYPYCVSDAALLPLRALVEANRREIKALVRRHKGRAVALFGSVARGDETEQSDLDFLVEFEPGSSLFDLADLEDDLASLLGRRVDVVSVGGLKPRDHAIRRDARWL